MIPNVAVEAAAMAWLEHGLKPGSMTIKEGMRDILEAAAPHLLTGAWDDGYDAAGNGDAKYENPYREAAK